MIKKIETKEKLAINNECWHMEIEFRKYLKGKVEWKTFEEIDIERVYFKRLIFFFRDKKNKKALSYYKKLSPKYIIFLSRKYPGVPKRLASYLLYTLMKKKGNMIVFLKFGLKELSYLKEEGEKKFYYAIYLYIQRCKMLFYKGKLNLIDRDTIDQMIEVFGAKPFFSLSTEDDNYIILRGNHLFLEIPREIPKEITKRNLEEKKM